MKGIFLLIGLTLICCLQPAAQSFWSLEQYSTREGLPSEVVSSIVKDDDGFMWFGTGEGIVRFDGHHFEKLHTVLPDSGQIVPSQIFGLIAASTTKLWVSTRGGLFVCNTDNGRCERILLPGAADESVDNDWISPLVASGNYLWGLTARHLVRLHIQDQSTHLIPLPKPQPTFFTLSGISVDQSGQLWLAIDYDIFRYEPRSENFTPIPLQIPGLSSDGVEAWSVLADDKGKVWCGTRDHGLLLFDQSAEQFRPYVQDGLFVRSLHQIEDEIWLGGGSKGLYRLAPGSRQLRDLSDTYPLGHNDSWPNQIYYDTTLQLIWIATQKGLEKIDKRHLHFESSQLDIQPNNNYPPFVLNVLGDRFNPDPDNYWLKVIEKGLYYWSPGQDRLRPVPGLKLGKANECLVQDGRGRVWVNQYSDPKLQVYNPRTRELITPPVPEAYLSCSYLYADRQGDIWVGTFENRLGKYKVNSQSFEEIGFFKNLPDPGDETDIVAITEDSRGWIWTITDTALYRLGPSIQEVRTIDLSSFLAKGVYLLSLLASEDGNIWLGTREGAFELDSLGRPLRQFRATDPLPLSFVFQIVEDVRHQLWFGTSQGLYYTAAPSGALRKFDPQNGLLGNNAYFLAGDPGGNIFVGFPSAINYLDTRIWPLQPTTAPLRVTELRVLDQPRTYEAGKTLVLGPRENFFTMRLSLLNYRQPADTRYRYRLSGFEEQWHDLDHDDHITYTNLDGGHYSLEVKAVTEQDPGREYQLSLPLRVIPLFHKTIWFYLLILLLILSIIGAFWYTRQMEAHRLQLLRQRIARDLHDDVGSSLSSIRFFTEFIRQSLASGSPDAADHLDRIGTSATNVTENMREIVWALQARADGLDALVAKIREYGARLLESRNISFINEIDPAFVKMKMDIHRQRNLYLICKEAFNNAAKYARCNQVVWEIRVKAGREVSLLIKDNGRGFDPAAITPGTGLASLQKRAEEMNGSMEINTAPGKGVMIWVEWR